MWHIYCEGKRIARTSNLQAAMECAQEVAYRRRPYVGVSVVSPRTKRTRIHYWVDPLSGLNYWET